MRRKSQSDEELNGREGGENVFSLDEVENMK